MLSRSVVALLVATALAAPVAAQSAAPAPRTTSVPQPVVRAVAPQPSGVTRVAAAAPAPAPIQNRPSTREGRLMVFGGAALLTGILVGGNAGSFIAVGGAVIGLYGLWQWLM